MLVRPFAIAGKARREIIALRDQIRIGQSDSDVRTLFDAADYQYLKLKEHSGNWWSVSTPLQFGAGNWVLYIEFSGPNVSRLKIRTEDSQFEKPPNAPPDKP